MPNKIERDDGSPLDVPSETFIHYTEHNFNVYDYQVRRLTRDVDVNTERGNKRGDVFIHGDKTWVYQGNEEWIEYESNNPQIKCPIPKMTAHVFLQKTGQWRVGNKLRDAQKVRDARKVIRLKKRPRVDSSDDEEANMDLNPENSWVLPYQKIIQNPKLPKSPLMAKMNAILTHVGKYKTQIPFFEHNLDGPQPENIRFIPTLPHDHQYSRTLLVSDLFQHKLTGQTVGIINSEVGQEDREYTVEGLVASLMGGLEEGKKVFAALNIFATKEGIGRMKIEWEDPFKTEENRTRAKEKGKSRAKPNRKSKSKGKGKGKEKEESNGEKWKVLDEDEGSTMTPFGHITFPHYDPYYANSVIYHFEGSKLWFTWPPTKKNLEVFWEQSNPNTYRDFIFWIDNLERLEIFLLNESGMSFIMPPFTLHACLSLSLSSHSGAPVMDESCLDMILTSMEAKLSLDLENLSGGALYQQVEGRRIFDSYAKDDWLSFSQAEGSGFSDESKEKVEKWVEMMEDWVLENERYLPLE